MMQRRSILSSLLLVSLLSTFAFSSAAAQNTVSVESTSSQRCAPGVLNVSIDISQDISALELVLSTSGDATVTGVTFDAGLANLGLRGDVSEPGTIRIYALDNTGGNDCLPAGSYVVAQIEYLTDDVCSGEFTVEGGTFVCQSNGISASSQVVTCVANPDPVTVPLVVSGGSVSINNNAPSIACPGNQTMHWGEILTINASATDSDEANGCETLSYSLGSGSPGYASVTQAGVIVLAPSGTDVCVGTVELIVSDKCGATDVCTFDVCVENTPPSVSSPADGDTLLAVWGEEFFETLIAGTDPDNGPFDLVYSIVSFDGPGSIQLDPATGEVSWEVLHNPDYLGSFNLCVSVTDGANVCDPCSPSNSDELCFVIHVKGFRVSIENVDQQIQGIEAQVSVFIDSNWIGPDSYETDEIGGFDFLIEYDASVLAATGSVEGELIKDKWEFFTFRFGPNGNCGTGCPTGKLRTVGLFETNDGILNTNTNRGPGELFYMTFQVSADRTLECNRVPIRFCWYDCGDNAFSDLTGDSLYINCDVYEWDGTEVSQNDLIFPTTTGAPISFDCDSAGGAGKPVPLRVIEFHHGGILIACSKIIDDRGDINLNGIAHEIADAVVFTNYFIIGLDAFDIINLETGDPAVQGQIQASDVNADGLVLTVADLVYLIRVIVGDALPFNKLAHNSTTAVITTQGPIVSTDVEMGAALFVFEGVADVSLLQDGLTIKTGIRNGNTYALVAPEVSEANGVSTTVIAAGDIVSSNTALLSVEASTFDGSVLNTVTEILPEHFALGQNYPNPFNPSTKINIDLPTASEYSLTIYNVSGQKVYEITGAGDAGVVTVEWEASAFASGIYFYKLSAGQYASTKKMLLLK